MLRAVLQPGMGDNPATFEATWKACEHQVDVHEKLAASKLDDDVKISEVLREAPSNTPRQPAGEFWLRITSEVTCKSQNSSRGQKVRNPKRQDGTVIGSSPRRSHQSNKAVENYRKLFQERVRTMATQGYTEYRPTTDSALMKRSVRHAARLIHQFRENVALSPFYRAMGWSVWWKVAGIWSFCACSPSRGGERIWESRTEAGRQVEIRRVAGQEQPHRRRSGQNR